MNSGVTKHLGHRLELQTRRWWWTPRVGMEPCNTCHIKNWMLAGSLLCQIHFQLTWSLIGSGFNSHSYASLVVKMPALELCQTQTSGRSFTMQGFTWSMALFTKSGISVYNSSNQNCKVYPWTNGTILQSLSLNTQGSYQNLELPSPILSVNPSFSMFTAFEIAF
jgi:hypothetical protein